MIGFARRLVGSLLVKAGQIVAGRALEFEDGGTRVPTDPTRVAQAFRDDITRIADGRRATLTEKGEAMLAEGMTPPPRAPEPEPAPPLAGSYAARVAPFRRGRP